MLDDNNKCEKQGEQQQRNRKISYYYSESSVLAKIDFSLSHPKDTGSS